MLGEWLLIECITAEPTVMAIGRKPIRLQPFHKVLRRESLRAARRLTNQVRRSGHRWEETSHDRDEHLIAEPILNAAGNIHGVRIWVGRPWTEVPPPPRSGAWDWNLDKMTALYTDEVYDLHQVPPERRRTEITRMSAMRHLAFAEDEGVALAMAVHADESTVFQDSWRIIRDDGIPREMNFCARGARVDGQRFVHGLIIDISDGIDEPAPPPPLTFSQAVMQAELSVPGVYHALVDLETLTAHRWLGTEMPGIAWELTGDPERDPALHPDDIATARRVSRTLDTGPATAVLRIRNVDGGWTPVRIEAKRVLLTRNPDIAAALVSVSHDTASQ
ncbi:GAF domain-containing protein [Nocardia lijiangensis]|uniref:GAF domain-containing protein n=1 Tax=Nocardia lijiangensis TaxID=299618 RepID=UPI00082BE5FD|nr:GAF domain-containing protein [Nocardia lijiangensis]